MKEIAHLYKIPALTVKEVDEAFDRKAKIHKFGTSFTLPQTQVVITEIILSCAGLSHSRLLSSPTGSYSDFNIMAIDEETLDSRELYKSILCSELQMESEQTKIFQEIDKRGNICIEWFELWCFLITLARTLKTPPPSFLDIDHLMSGLDRSRLKKLTRADVQPLLDKLLQILAGNYSLEALFSRQESYQMIEQDP